MSEMNAHLLLENEDQVSMYFQFLSEFNKMTQADPAKSPFGVQDAVKSIVACAAVTAFYCREALNLGEFTEENREELIKLFSNTLDAMNDSGTVKHFMPH